MLEGISMRCEKGPAALLEMPKTQALLITFEVMPPGLEDFLEGLALAKAPLSMILYWVS